MADSLSTHPAAKAMRRKAQAKRGEGWVRNNFWLSPDAIETLDQARDAMGLSSREAAINAVLDRIRTDMFLQQEFLAVTK
ncbi:hypothetical protein [Novosphingobium sp. ST904]|jgi:hypothetical protein|uniref:hypothetical protein n=1 Tax=Novosphingobium sp. ST904 TaxID=1684385 RepID=UPI0006CC3A51|nr:hypothetical protein [Novosphingobium sp. ST904]KPH63582.1 hypothetical protein ADT71_13205 [Novosphingobium sp. ST904]TCM32338.1 hypothetical protein EDF59_12433 [Novosphingobium sp. ST904]